MNFPLYFQESTGLYMIEFGVECSQCSTIDMKVVVVIENYYKRKPAIIEYLCEQCTLKGTRVPRGDCRQVKFVSVVPSNLMPTDLIMVSFIPPNLTIGRFRDVWQAAVEEQGVNITNHCMLAFAPVEKIDVDAKRKELELRDKELASMPDDPIDFLIALQSSESLISESKKLEDKS